MDVLSQYSPGQILGFFWLNNILRYLLVAGLTYVIFWKWGFERFKDRFLYKEKPTQKDVKREFLFSLLSTLVFLTPKLMAIPLKQLGVNNKIYFSISQYGLGWYFVSFLMVFLIHDTYFYWTHRLMHHKKLYRFFHHVHHLSKKPTPLAAFAFHPSEAFVEAVIFMIISFTMPVHFSVLLSFTFFSLFMNVYGHLGFSLFAEEKLQKAPLKYFGHPSTHSWHHQNYNGNYGFYLTFWDKAMGTFKGSLKK